MVKTMIRRVIIMIPQLFIIMLATFALAYIMPGDFVTTQMFGGDFTWHQIMEQRERLGLDDPWYTQFTRWFGAVIRGDFGHSAVHARPVMDVVGDRMGNTFRLSLMSTILLFAIGIPLGILAGRFYRKPIDKIILIYGFVGAALPTIVLGILLVWLFGLRLDWLPPRGSVDPFLVGTGFREFISRIEHMILPSIAIATFNGVGMIYILRSQIVDGRSSDYAMTARSKGVPEKVIFNKHILRNSLIPFAQGIGFTFVSLFGGTVLIEQFFSFPGMGDLFLSSITSHDFTTVSGLVLIYSILSVVAVLIGDIALTLADPRIRVK